jgi:hypothetical protein
MQWDLPFSSRLGYDVLYRVGVDSRPPTGYQLVYANKEACRIQWKCPLTFPATITDEYDPVIVTASLQSRGDKASILTVTSTKRLVGLDAEDHMWRVQEYLTNPLSYQISKLIAQQEEIRREIQGQIDRGLLCPTCGKEFKTAVGFCPNDGTRIGRMCQNCKNIEPPNAHFCSKCGTNL